MNYSERLKLMAALQESRNHHAHAVQFLDSIIGELQRVDELECENAWLQDMQRKSFMKSLEAMPKTDQELKDIEQRQKLMANRGHWIITPDGKKKRIDK